MKSLAHLYVIGGQHWIMKSYQQYRTAPLVKQIALLLPRHHCTLGNGLQDHGADFILTTLAPSLVNSTLLSLMHIPNGSMYTLSIQHLLSQCVISKLCAVFFATHGLPEQIVSDSGSRFISTEFKKILPDNGIKQIWTSPYHPSSNGLAERAIQIFKSTVKKFNGPMKE